MSYGPSADRTALQPSLRMGELLGAFAFASDLAFGLRLEDGLRCCYLAMRLADALALPPSERVIVYYTALLKDAGCTCWMSQLAKFLESDEIAARRELQVFGDPMDRRSFAHWMEEHVATGQPEPDRLARSNDVLQNFGPFILEGVQSSCEVSARIGRRLGMPLPVEESLAAVWERWDGRGMPNGLAGRDVPLVSRIVLPSFFLVAFHERGGREAAVEVARAQRGMAFDPAVVDAFLDLAESDDFWAGLEQDAIWDAVLDDEPESPYRAVSDERLDDVAEAFADFADLKSPYTAAHSRRVAAHAAEIARRMGCNDREANDLRRAALVHDLGLVAVPSFVLNRPEPGLGASEREQLRLHPYHVERILSHVPPLIPLASLVGAHHERMDGRGYYRGLTREQIPLAARILAVADRFDELTHDQPGAAAQTVEEALTTLTAEAGDGLCPDVVGVLSSADAPSSRRGAGRTVWPVGLTNREVDVLRLAARGLTRKEIADVLVVAEPTVRHHLEHIYDKTDCSTRVGATLFAMEHGLLP